MRIFLLLVIFTSWSQGLQELNEVEPEENSEEVEIQVLEAHQRRIELNLVELDDEELYELADSSVWQKIIRHRRITGYYFSEYEIQSIEDISPEVVQQLLPYLSAERVPDRLSRDLKKADNHYLMLRRSMGEGGSLSGRYRRSLRSRHSLSLNFAQGSFGWTIRMSGFLYLSAKTRLTFGHYKSDWGMGLLLGSYSPGKNAEPLYSALHASAEEIPWNSSGMHFKGMALKHAFTRKISAKLLLSAQKDPAVVRDSLLHYWLWSPTEKSDWVTEYNAALAVQRSSITSESGFLFLQQRSQFSQLRWDSSSSRISYSAFLRKRIQENRIAAELSLTDQRPALTASLLSPLSAKVESVLNLRWLSQGYYSRHMNSFSVSYQSPSVSAFYAALRYIPNRQFQFSTYIDHLRFLHEKWFVRKQQTDLALLALLKFSRSHYSVIKIQRRFQNDWPERWHTWHLQVQQVIESKPFRIKGRFQWADAGQFQAWAAGGEVEYKILPFSLIMGVSFYKIEHYKLKQSWYERNLYLTSGFTWFYDEGENRYGLLTISLKKNIKLCMRVFYQVKKDEYHRQLDLQLLYRLDS